MKCLCDLILRGEVSGSYPFCISKPLFVRADILPLAIFYVHRDNAFDIRHFAYPHKQAYVQVLCDEEAPRTIKKLYLVSFIIAKRTTQDGDQLTVSLKAFDFAPACVLSYMNAQSIVLIPHPARKRIDELRIHTHPLVLFVLFSSPARVIYRRDIYDVN
jgi:hypothetical protein